MCIHTHSTYSHFLQSPLSTACIFCKELNQYRYTKKTKQQQQLFGWGKSTELNSLHAKAESIGSILDSHLLQQWSGLLWNRLGDVESCVATDSCWMALEQRLWRGKEGWKEEITINPKHRKPDSLRAEGTDIMTPAEPRSMWEQRDWTNRRRPKSLSTWNNTDHSNYNKDMISLVLLFLGTAVYVRQERVQQNEWHGKTYCFFCSLIQNRFTGRVNSSAAAHIKSFLFVFQGKIWPDQTVNLVNKELLHSQKN